MNKLLLCHVALSALSMGGLAATEPAGLGGGFTRTTGGIHGKVIRVTNLHAKGPGSLRAAIEAEGERLVVFEVGGIIDLEKDTLEITEPSITIAGQTAPSPGITIIQGAILIRTHDVVIQHIGVRPGDAGGAKRSGREADAISTAGADAHDIVVDHCSLTWATDENLSASGPRLDGPEGTSRRVTFSNNIIAECLHDSTHPKRPHSCGSLIHDFCQEIAVIGNLFAHNQDRNPYFKAHTTGAIVNNVIYNPGTFAIQLGYNPAEWRRSDYEPENPRVAVVGNVLMHGPTTRAYVPLVRVAIFGQQSLEYYGDAYLNDNLAFDLQGEPVAMYGSFVRILEEKPVWPGGLRPLSASEIAAVVLRNVGARPWDRDAIDRRIIRTVEERGGRIIDSQEEVGGYPSHPPATRPLGDVPKTNRQEWLDGFAKPVPE